MNTSQLDALFSWFDRYVEPFLATDEEGEKNIRLKIVHTRKVCEVMELLAEGEQLSENDARLASATALLHDAGRFPQYRRWRTFRDSDSDNHARLGIEVLQEERVLDQLPKSEHLLIEEAIRFHNLLALPLNFSSPTALYIRLIRDADKLDIWRVFIGYYESTDEEKPEAISLGLKDVPS